MQYCSLQHWTLLPSPFTSTTGCCFHFASISSFFSGVISPLFSSSILGTYQLGEFIFQCPIFSPFHTVHRVFKVGILKWFAIPFSSGPCLSKLWEIVKDRETWSLSSMNQGKLEVVKQEMARVNINILGISDLKLTGVGEFKVP